MNVVASIDDIRAEMQRRIDASTWGSGFCRLCPAPSPYRILNDGIANWTAHVAATAKPGCEGYLLEIVALVRRDYDLPPQSLSEAITEALHGRKPDL